jgi:hypothetical protein
MAIDFSNGRYKLIQRRMLGQIPIARMDEGEFVC